MDGEIETNRLMSMAEAAAARKAAAFNPNNADLFNPADRLRGGLLQPNNPEQQAVDYLLKLQKTVAPAAPTPIKVFTVCVEPGVGEYMAFLGSDPTKRVTAGSREAAVATLLADQKLIVMTEID